MNLSDFHLTPIARWPYEQAFATTPMFVFDRDDDWHQIEEMWSAKFGTHADNKVTFKTLIHDSKTEIYVTFHDFKVWIGTGVRPYRGGELAEPQVIK